MSIEDITGRDLCLPQPSPVWSRVDHANPDVVPESMVHTLASLGFMRPAGTKGDNVDHLALVYSCLNGMITPVYEEYVNNQGTERTRESFGDENKWWDVSVVDRAIRSMYPAGQLTLIDPKKVKYWRRDTPGMFIVTGIMNSHYRVDGKRGACSWRDYDESDSVVNFEDGSWNHTISIRRGKYHCNNSFGFGGRRYMDTYGFHWFTTDYMHLDEDGQPETGVKDGVPTIAGHMRQINRVYQVNFGEMKLDPSVSATAVFDTAMVQRRHDEAHG